jgi:hypothetical protein
VIQVFYTKFRDRSGLEIKILSFTNALVYYKERRDGKEKSYTTMMPDFAGFL